MKYALMKVLDCILFVTTLVFYSLVETDIRWGRGLKESAFFSGLCGEQISSTSAPEFPSSSCVVTDRRVQRRFKPAPCSVDYTVTYTNLINRAHVVGGMSRPTAAPTASLELLAVCVPIISTPESQIAERCYAFPKYSVGLHAAATAGFYRMCQFVKRN